MERHATPRLKRLWAGRYTVEDYEIVWEGWIGKSRVWRIYYKGDPWDGFPTLREAAAEVMKEIEAERPQ